ncbi:hypothetical protein CB1_000465065 [Camelus ferus]|nr:hypothetical protein CB1_000465065 [Camelus ferus]
MEESSLGTEIRALEQFPGTEGELQAELDQAHRNAAQSGTIADPETRSRGLQSKHGRQGRESESRCLNCICTREPVKLSVPGPQVLRSRVRVVNGRVDLAAFAQKRRPQTANVGPEPGARAAEPLSCQEHRTVVSARERVYPSPCDPSVFMDVKATCSAFAAQAARVRLLSRVLVSLPVCYRVWCGYLRFTL